MEQSQNNQESFEQKIIRNVKAGAFAVYKTPNVVGDKNMIANIEWEDPEQVDKFFAFAKSLGAKVIYVAEEDEIDEETHTTKTNIIQVGFLHDSVMHHINLDDDEDDEEDEDEYDDEEEYDEEHDEEEAVDEDEEEHEEHHEPAPITPQTQPNAQPSPQPSPQPQAPVQQQAPQQPNAQQPWPGPQ